MEICAALLQCLIPKIASKLLKEKTGSKEHSTTGSVKADCIFSDCYYP